MKIVRRIYTLTEAERGLHGLLSNYLEALENNEWAAAERTYCDRVECGFRNRCWSAT